MIKESNKSDSDYQAHLKTIQSEVFFNRLKQESLSDLKDEAFSIPTVKNSSLLLKRLLRRSKTKLEISSYVAIIIAEDLKLNNLAFNS